MGQMGTDCWWVWGFFIRWCKYSGIGQWPWLYNSLSLLETAELHFFEGWNFVVCELYLSKKCLIKKEQTALFILQVLNKIKDWLKDPTIRSISCSEKICPSIPFSSKLTASFKSASCQVVMPADGPRCLWGTHTLTPQRAVHCQLDSKPTLVVAQS